MKSFTSRRFREMYTNLPEHVRLQAKYRAVGQVEGSEIVWFWIGLQGDYDKLV